jgi:hypothetical protein
LTIAGDQTPGGNVNIGSSTSNINIKNQDGALASVNIMTGSPNTGSINLATGTGTMTVSIGSGATTGAIAIGNTGNTTTIAGTVNIGSAGLTTNINNMAGATGTVDIMSGVSSTGTINLGTGTGSKKVNIGTGTTTGAIAIGNTGNTTTIAGNINIGSAGLTTNINNLAGTTGTVDIMGGLGSTGTINLGTGTGSKRVNIGTGTTTGAITIGNSANNTSLLGSIRMSTLQATNYISRRGDVTQTIGSGGSDTTVLFPLLLSPSNASLVYNLGIFTNSSNRQLTLMVSYTVSFSNASTAGQRNVKINNSTASPQVAYNIVDATTTGFTSITGSATFVIANTQAFNIQCFQNSGISLPLDTNYTTIQILMF